MRTGTVYALSCLDGPMVYVGATYCSIDDRIKVHWRQSGLTHPIYRWLRQLKNRDDLQVMILETVSDHEDTPRQQCILWKREADLIKQVATDLLQSHSVLSLNVSKSPYRLLSPQRGEAFRHLRCAETISPYELNVAKAVKQ